MSMAPMDAVVQQDCKIAWARRKAPLLIPAGADERNWNSIRIRILADLESGRLPHSVSH
jgi:hypothetical protein